jgi:hypothetical protein
MEPCWEVCRFGWAALKHWATLATGSVITALVFAYSKWRGHDLGAQSYLWLLAAFVVMAMFLAWRDQYREAKRLQGVLAAQPTINEEEIKGRFFEAFKRELHDEALKNRLALASGMPRSPTSFEDQINLAAWQVGLRSDKPSPALELPVIPGTKKGRQVS